MYLLILAFFALWSRRDSQTMSGYFIAGKYDQVQRGTPYSAIMSAFRSLVRQLLTESASQLERWRETLLEALGPNGRVIIEVIPEVELIIGSQPPVPELGASETQNRFNLVFQSFIRALARPAHPLVIFLDDLQWADSASLRLLELVMSDENSSCLLLIGAYRDNEVGPGHLLPPVLESLRGRGVSVHGVHLEPLALEHIAAMCADTLDCGPEEARPLAELIRRKTAGNPLFVNEFLKTTYREGLIAFEREVGRWTWDTARIEDRIITDSVVTLMVEKIRRLPEETQRLLRLAACIGNSFDLHTLATIDERNPPETYADLTSAIREGLILATSEPELDAAGALIERDYKFLHDRVQQAAYALIADDQKKRVHLRIGRLMWASASVRQRSERVFDITSQLNVGIDLITTRGERNELASLNLEAGIRAKDALAYAAARAHLVTAKELLPDDAWETEYRMTRQIYSTLIEVEYLNGNYRESETLSHLALDRLHTEVEKAEIYVMLIAQYTMLGDYPKSLDTAIAGLALLGVNWPKDVDAAFETEFAATQEYLGGRKLSFLLDAPEMTDPWAKGVERILWIATAAAFYDNFVLYSWITLKRLNLGLEYGLSDLAPSILGMYGLILTGSRGWPELGYEAGQFAVDLLETQPRFRIGCESHFVFAVWLAPWLMYFHDIRRVSAAGYQLGLETGDLRWAGYLLWYKHFFLFYDGTPLSEVAAELPASLHFNEKAQSQMAIDNLLGLTLILANLDGETRSDIDFSTESLDEADFLASGGENQSFMGLCYYHIFKEFCLYLHGYPELALRAADRATELLPYIPANVARAYHNLHSSLSYAALHADASEKQREEYRRIMNENHAEMKRWAALCPKNFAHMEALIAAEIARISGDADGVRGLYKRAIELARENEFLHHEAVANELAAVSCLERGDTAAARQHMLGAHYGYRLWGAKHKVAQLTARYPDLLARPEPAASAVSTAPRSSASSDLDLISVVKSCQAISREIVLEKLLSKLMDIVIENAGAERGVLILEDAGTSMVQVDLGVESGVVNRPFPIPVADYPAISEGVVNYVARTRQSVLLGDACQEGGFIWDPYIARYRIRSLLCTPLISQGQLTGMLYLENNLARGTFTPARLDTLRLLAFQIAISIENAHLYNEMERKVAARTRELASRNADLREALAHLEKTQGQLIIAEKMASLGRISSGIAHELKNPLNFIVNFSEMAAETTRDLLGMAESRPDLPIVEICEDLGDTHVQTAQIRKHAQRADDIIGGMMRHSYGLASARELIEVNALIDNYLRLAKGPPDAGSAGDTVVIECDYDPEAGTIDVAPRDIGSVVLNLINNALYAVNERASSGVARYTPRVSVRTRRRDDRVEIRVEDNGPGMSEEVRSKIFEPFFTTKPPGSGTGLGLSLSYDIVVHGHGGELSVQSVEGERTTFVIELPTSPRA